MALTISTHPSEVITNAPLFTVDTSLVEGASYQNLRIRATLYIGGYSVAKAVLEQPDGLNDWDLTDILKSFRGKCDYGVGNSTGNIKPAIGSQLLTAWTNLGGLFETFSTSGRTITSIIDSNASGGVCQSNDIGSAALGDVFVVGIDEDYVDGGVADVQLSLSAGASAMSYVNYAGLSSGELIPSHVYFLMATETTTDPHINLYTSAGANASFSGTPSCYKITDFRNNPCVYFMVKFEEVYENASNVTTIGDSELTDTLLFVPATVRAGEAFTDYLITTTGKKLLSRAEDGDIKYKFGIGMEVRLLYVTTSDYLQVSITTDAGEEKYVNIPNMGWGMVILNDDTASVAATDESWQVDIYSTNYGGISPGDIIYLGASATIPCEANCYPSVKALSFIGDLGEEVIMFRGQRTETGKAEKEFYRDVNRISHVLSSFRSVIVKLRTIYETDGVRKLIHELISSENEVWMYDEDADDNYYPVGVITDEVMLYDKLDLIENEVEVEYHE